MAKSSRALDLGLQPAHARGDKIRDQNRVRIRTASDLQTELRVSNVGRDKSRIISKLPFGTFLREALGRQASRPFLSTPPIELHK